MRYQALAAAAAALSLFVLSGCQMWQPGGSPVSGRNNAFTITPPSDWMYSTRAAAATTNRPARSGSENGVPMEMDLVASKEGLILQNLVVMHHDLAKPLEHSRRSLNVSIAPYEAAEAVLDDLRADHTLLGFEVQENTPATVGGHPGFRLVVSYHTADKLHLTSELYGAIAGSELWLVRYSAPARHYFERDRQVFEQTVQTLKLGSS